VNTDIGFSVAYQDRGGTVQVVPTFGGPEAAVGDVNEAGVIVGAADVALRGFPHAFLWDGTLHDLGTLGGTMSGAGAINDHGQVVGWSYTADETKQHAFFHDGATMHDLGTFGGERGGVGDINNLGQIVGSAYTSGQNGEPGASRPILYENGIAHNLIDLIASEPRPGTGSCNRD
jgi:probable HAF family extracellular repeat protein